MKLEKNNKTKIHCRKNILFSLTLQVKNYTHQIFCNAPYRRGQRSWSLVTLHLGSHTVSGSGQLCQRTSSAQHLPADAAFTIQFPSLPSEPWLPLPLKWSRLWAWHMLPLSSLPWPAHKKELSDLGGGKQLSEMPTTKLWRWDRARPQTTSKHSSKHCRNALSYPNSSMLEGLHRSNFAMKGKYNVGGFEDQLPDGKFSYLILREKWLTLLLFW